jgi:hypothetical protein
LPATGAFSRVAGDGEPACRQSMLAAYQNQITASMMTALLTKAAARLNAIRMTNSC